jgi:hypothetical protein
MLKGSFLFLTTLLVLSSWQVLAQQDSLPDVKGELIPMSSQIGISDREVIDLLMPVMPGLGEKGRSLIAEQSVKPYLMPPRHPGEKGDLTAYLLASLLEFYVNFDENFKDNLSPDYISLNNPKGDPEAAFRFLAETGTVSAAIMPFNATNISSAVFATHKYKIQHYLHLFASISKPRQKVFEIRKALTRGNPVLVYLAVDDTFLNLKGKTIWQPGKNKTDKLVPVLVVSFDQEKELLELRGAWGKSWGNDGYTQVPYDTFSLHAEDGYVLVPAP